MRTLTRFGFVFVVLVLCFFSGSIFLVASALRFSISADPRVVSVLPLTSTTTSFKISLDPLTADEGENRYSLTLKTPCAQKGGSGVCLDVDPTPDLCKYLTISPQSGDSFDEAFVENAKSEWFDAAYARLFNPNRLESSWRVEIASPCFEGECPATYDSNKFGLPALQTLKGKTLKCEVSVKYEPPVFLMKGNTESGRAYAATGTDRIEISAIFGAGSPYGCTTNCFSNVAFIPGIQASRLYALGDDPDCPECQDRLWEPSSDIFARKLYLDSSGSNSLHNADIYTRDIVRSAYGVVSIYSSFVEQMNSMKSDHIVNNWESLPYDWRLSFNDILNSGKKIGDRIYYQKATNTPFILQEIKHLAETSKTGKVTIVAHSNGGLLTKAIMRRLEAQGLQNLVDKIIFVAVPQVGTPQAVIGMLHGEGQGIPFDWFSPLLSKSTARNLAENAPGAYGLLPSAGYFTSVQTPLITFTNPLSSLWGNYYGGLINSQAGLHDFLTDSILRHKPEEGDLSTPNVLNSTLLVNTKSVHNDIDSWTAPSGVKVVQIAGWGIPSTLSAIKYTDQLVNHSGRASFEPKFVSDGDGTVVAPSALWMSGPNVERYWVDLGEYNNFFLTGNLPRKHADILEVSELRNFIKNIITNKNISLPTYLSTSEPTSNPSLKRLQFSLHSPLSLDLFDDLGRHTGISTTTGKVEEGVPGTYYKEVGEVKYIFSDESIQNRIRMSGQGTGTFTLNIDELQGGVVLASTTFANIPTTPETEARIDIVDTLSSTSNLRVDLDGNGISEIVLIPKLGEIVTDQTAPTTSVNFVGTLGSNDWYISDVRFALLASDTESFVASTTYSLDNGLTWQDYSSTTAPIVTSEGTTTVLFYSTDIFGNKEQVRSSIIRIDKTPPEALITFNPRTKKLWIVGTDNLTNSPTVTNFATSSVITDESGHTLKVGYFEKKQKDRRINLEVTNLTYDKVSNAVSPTSLRYKWNTKKNGGYAMFVEYLRSGTNRLEGHFRPKKNETILMLKPVEPDDDDEDTDSDTRPAKLKLTGLRIAGLKTERGIIRINY